MIRTLEHNEQTRRCAGATAVSTHGRCVASSVCKIPGQLLASTKSTLASGQVPPEWAKPLGDKRLAGRLDEINSHRGCWDRWMMYVDVCRNKEAAGGDEMVRGVRRWRRCASSRLISPSPQAYIMKVHVASCLIVNGFHTRRGFTIHARWEKLGARSRLSTSCPNAIYALHTRHWCSHYSFMELRGKHPP